MLVAGGAGFLGSWLCECLIKLHARVMCLDNLSTGRIGNIEHLMSSNLFSFIEADVNTWNLENEVDWIIHGASIPSPEDYMEKPVETMLPNSLGLLKLLDSARLKDATLLYMSSSEIYGDAELVPTRESYWGRVNPVGLRGCYDESKRFGESLCMSYFRQYGVDVKIARIFNTYGPKMDSGATYARVVPNFIVQSLRNNPLTIHGDGLQTRSFCYVSDTATALLKMLVCSKCQGEAINIGSSNEITILELAELIKQHTNSRSPLEFQAPRPDDPRRRRPDTSKAKNLLYWTPKISLDKGLEYTIRWFKEAIQSAQI